MGAQPVTRLSRFGPSALLTPANLVTMLRFALTVPLLRIIAEDGVSWRATALGPATAGLAGFWLSLLWVAVVLTVVSGLDIVLVAVRSGRVAAARPGP